MQKYYHRGAFYQNSEEEDDYKLPTDTKNENKTSYKSIFKRDFNMPTLEDKVDKSVMPSLLQKRMGTFGRKGQSKWTHLTNEDTTNFNPDTRVNENIAKA
jgi:microfibrillar-associated protein 1